MSDLFGDLDLDADAARREARYPEGIPVVHRGERFVLPAELPADALDPLLDIDVDMAQILQSALRLQQSGDEEAQKVGGEVVIEALLGNPSLPVDVWRGIQGSLRVLFGEQQWERFVATRPSIPTYARLVRGLWRAYGVGLGEAFASAAPSGAGGETSSTTSSPSTGSTRGASGGGRAKKGSSGSAA